MEKIIEKANTLIEALPYMRKFNGKTVVIKYGGNAMVDEAVTKSIVEDIILMKYIGINPVVVHGGGPAINEMLEKVGKKTEFIKGNRVTDDEAMELVEMVLTGKVNKSIVNLINQYGGKAVGITGKDANLIVAEKKYLYDGAEKIDIGHVGDVKKINPAILQDLEEKGYIPVISPIGVDKDGNTYNINADYVAGEIAGAIKADKFILLTNVKGILKDINDPDSLVSVANYNEMNRLINGGIVQGGMLPKVEACMTAVRKGTDRAHILDGRVEHAIVLEMFTDRGIGTMIERKCEEE